jgi:phosphomannomutase
LDPGIDIDDLLEKIRLRYKSHPISTVDGIRIRFNGEWVHIRKSNTEPIIRIYAESNHQEKADNLARKITRDFREILNNTET